MSDYHFHPLRDFHCHGVLETPEGPRLAEFLSVSTVRSTAFLRRLKEERELIDRLRAEAAMPERYPRG